MVKKYSCTCRVCLHAEEFEKHKVGLSADQISFFNDMYEAMVSAETDRDMLNLAIRRLTNPGNLNKNELHPLIQSAVDNLYVAMKMVQL